MKNFSNRERITWHLTMLEGLIKEEREMFESIIEGLNLRIHLKRIEERGPKAVLLASLDGRD